MRKYHPLDKSNPKFKKRRHANKHKRLLSYDEFVFKLNHDIKQNHEQSLKGPRVYDKHKGYIQVDQKDDSSFHPFDKIFVVIGAVAMMIVLIFTALNN